MLEAGLRAVVEETVTEERTARSVGSGDVPVYATPALLALVERAAIAAVAERLDEGSTTVGARVALRHEAPTPVGGRVSATAVLEAVEGRRLRFRFEVADDGGSVATGTHERVLVDRDRFLEGAARRV